MDPRIECCTAALDNALLCRFKDASVTIRKTTTAFHYQLVVCKIYEEGERELINDEEDEEDGLYSSFYHGVKSVFLNCRFNH